MERLRPVEGFGNYSSGGDDIETPAAIQSLFTSVYTLQQHAECKHEERGTETEVEPATTLGRQSAGECREAYEALLESQPGSLSGTTGYLKPYAIQ